MTCFETWYRWEGKKTMNISTFRENETIVYEYIRSNYKLWCIWIISVMCKIKETCDKCTKHISKQSQYTKLVSILHHPHTNIYKYTFIMIYHKVFGVCFPDYKQLNPSKSRGSLGEESRVQPFTYCIQGAAADKGVVLQWFLQATPRTCRQVLDGYTPCKYKHSTWKVGDQKDEFPFEKAFLQGPSFREGSSVVHHDMAVSPSLRC